MITKSQSKTTYQEYLKDHSEIFRGQRRQVCLPDGPCTDGYAKAEKGRKACRIRKSLMRSMHAVS